MLRSETCFFWHSNYSKRCGSILEHLNISELACFGIDVWFFFSAIITRVIYRKGPLKCYVMLFFWKFDTLPPPTALHNAWMAPKANLPIDDYWPIIGRSVIFWFLHRFVAERGNKGQLTHVENIDVAYNLKPLPRQPSGTITKQKEVENRIERPLAVTSCIPR